MRALIRGRITACIILHDVKNSLYFYFYFYFRFSYGFLINFLTNLNQLSYFN